MSALKSFTIATFSVCSLAVGSLNAEPLERVEFRLMEWKSFHLDQANQAKTYYETFKSLGCECRQETHGDHTDVTFRCPKWRSLSLKSHSQAHKWEAFLKKAGFETKHEH